MKFVVVYDIENDKVRNKIADFLGEYGIRVNYSVFEIELTKSQLKKLQKKILENVNIKFDSVRFYYINETTKNLSFELCKRGEIFEEINLFF
jgi:CRISPR-associated protein Cas2